LENKFKNDDVVEPADSITEDNKEVADKKDDESKDHAEEKMTGEIKTDESAENEVKTDDSVEVNANESAENAVKTNDSVEVNTNEKPKKKLSPLNIIISIICLAVFIFAVSQIIISFLDDKDTDLQIDNLRDIVHNNSDDITDNDIDDDNGDIDVTVQSDSTDDLTEFPAETGGYEEFAEELDTYVETEEARIARMRDKTLISADQNIDYKKLVLAKEVDLNKVPFMQVNLNQIINMNSDTVAWIYVGGPPVGSEYHNSLKEFEGIPIDIAVVQTTDNDFYLNHAFDKKESKNGWVFADCDNNMKEFTSNYNSVFYGHARNTSMFAGLKNLDKYTQWYANAYNHFIKINTATEQTVWQIFSWYEIDYTKQLNFNYIQTDITKDNVVAFATEVQSRNVIAQFQKFEFTEDSRILTLSTCKGYDATNRVAVHAVLVKVNPITE